MADPSVATITDDGILNGLSNGITEVYGSLNGHIDTLAVRVAIPAAKPLHFDDFIQDYSTRWTSKATGAKNMTVTPDAEGCAVLSFDYTAGRDAKIRFASEQYLYSAPEEFQLRFTPQGDLIESVSIGLRANNAASNTIYSTKDITPDTPMTINIPLDSLFGVHNDLAIYPVTVKFITLAFNTKAEKKQYNIPVQGIYLTYKGSPSTDIKTADRDNTESSKTVKFVQNGQLYVIRNGQIYNILGTKVN